MQQCRDAVGRMSNNPLLHGSRPVTNLIGVTGLLHGKLREVANAVRYQLVALGGVEPSLLVEEHVHIHTSQLGDTLLLGHPLIEFIHLLFHICLLTSDSQQGCTGQRQQPQHPALPASLLA